MRVVSLFSGAGGLDLGLIQAGHKVVWANDIDSDAVATYRHNIGNEIVADDIAAIDPHDLPSCDVIVGGFPCQGFSQANLRRWEGDERNKLFTFFAKALRAKQPRYFIAENVRGILSLGGGTVLARIMRIFQRANYHVECHVINAANYGVPQNRIRVLFMGTRKDIPHVRRLELPTPSHAAPRDVSRLGLLPWVTSGEALAAIPDITARHALPNHVCSKYKVAYRNFTGHRRTDPEKPSPTILARGNGKGGVCAIPHPFRERRMSVRESACIQTFPLDFEFFGGLNSMYRQVGNAVPVLVGRRLGESLAAAASRRIR